MYRKMKKTLKISRNTHIPFLKSKNGLLTETDKKILDQLSVHPFFINYKCNIVWKIKTDQCFRSTCSRQPQCGHRRTERPDAFTRRMVS